MGFTIHYLTNSTMTKCFIFAVLFISEVFGQLKFGGSRPSTSTFTVNVRRKFFNSQCCDRAEQFCEAPCAGQSCSAGCRVKCGFFSSLCPAVSCGVANPAQCTGGSGGSTSSCDSGYTLAGSRCYKLVTSSSNYLQAVLGCERMGASLATVNSQVEQDAVFSLTGSSGAWIGLTDFLNEGTFSWVDETVLSFTNFRSGQPNNGNNNQHCVWIRADGTWDDVICQQTKSYVCHKNARP